MKREIDRLNDILERSACGFSISHKEINKNGIMMDGISIHDADHNADVIFYPDEKFLKLSDETKLALLTKAHEEHATNFDIGSSFSKNYILENVYPKLVPEERQDTLQNDDVVFCCYLNLLMEFVVMLNTDDERISCYTLHKQHISHFDLSVEDIRRKALCNAGNAMTIRSMRSLLGKICDGVVPPDEDIPMYIVSNKWNFYGAGGMASHRMSEVGDILGEPFIILPSSVHEIICIPSGVMTDLNAVLSMVKDVNESLVDPIEVLSDSVYIYEDGYISVYQG